MNKKLIRVLGVYFLLDGLLTLLFGRSYVRLFRFGPRRSLYRRIIDGLLRLPKGLLRGGGAAEAGLGLAVLSQAPFDVTGLYRWVAGGYAVIDPGWREWFYPQAHQAFDRRLTNSLPGNGKVLDLGSGVGANLSRLLALRLPFGSYTGVDLTDAMLERARQRYGSISNVRFQQLDLLRDPLPDGPYDLIVSTWVFEHLSDPALAANKAWEQLRPGGRMVLLFEDEALTNLSRLVDRIYPFLAARLVRASDYRRFPGQVVDEQHFSGPLGDLALLVLEKPRS